MAVFRQSIMLIDETAATCLTTFSAEDAFRSRKTACRFLTIDRADTTTFAAGSAAKFTISRIW